MEKIGSFFTKLNHIALTICGIFIALAGVLASVNAILRFTRGTGFAFSDEMCVYLIALMIFIAMGYLEYSDNHLTIDIFNTTVKNPVIKKIVLYIRGIITLIFDGMLIRYGLIVTSAAYRYGSVTNVMQIQRFYIYGIVTASMILAFASWIVLLVCRKGEFEQC